MQPPLTPDKDSNGKYTVYADAVLTVVPSTTDEQGAHIREDIKDFKPQVDRRLAMGIFDKYVGSWSKLDAELKGNYTAKGLDTYPGGVGVTDNKFSNPRMSFMDYWSVLLYRFKLWRISRRMRKAVEAKLPVHSPREWWATPMRPLKKRG